MFIRVTLCVGPIFRSAHGCRFIRVSYYAKHFDLLMILEKLGELFAELDALWIEVVPVLVQKNNFVELDFYLVALNR